MEDTENVLRILWLVALTTIIQAKHEYPEEAFVYARYDDPCDAHTTPCDHDANFECRHGLCECSLPQMTYNPEALECRIKAGAKCSYLVERDANERKQHIAHRLTFPCTSNATCGDDGICRCSPFYYPDNSGKCQETKRMGGDCDRSSECDSEAGLVCWRGRCGCNPMISRSPLGYGPQDTCVGIPGKPCVNGQCELNSECVGNKCICAPGFQLNRKERRCRGMFDESCVDDTFCGLHYTCVGSRCKCKGPDQVFDDVLQRCFSIVGDLCARDEDCVPNAICSLNSTGKPLCQCDDGYVEFGPGFCRNGLGSSCTERQEERTYLVEKDSLLASSFTDLGRPANSGSRFDTLLLINVEAHGCDSNRKLRCINGKCSCVEGIEVFSERLGKCVSLANTLCNVLEPHGCVDHAHCVPLPNVQRAGVGRCVCDENYTAGTHRFCLEL